MAPVAGTFQVAGHSAGLSSAKDVSHTPAETDGIGTDHSVLLALVAEYYHAVIVVSAVELEGTQIDPGAAPDLLVDLEFRDTSFMEHQVFGIGYALRKGLVTDVYGIASGLRNVGNPFGKGFLRFRQRADEAGGSVGKRIVVLGIGLVFLGKSRELAFLPAVFPLVVDFQVTASAGAGIVVHDYLVALPVALTRGEDDGSGIFEHRYQVRDDNRLGEEVFGGSEKTGTLPYPFSLALLVEASVALPDGKVTVLKTAADGVGTGDVLDPGSHRPVGLCVQAALVFLGLAAEGVRNQVLNGLPVGIYRQSVVVDRSREDLLDGAVDGLDILFRKRLVSESGVGINADGFFLVIDLHVVQTAGADMGIGGLIIGEEVAESLLDIVLQALCLKTHGGCNE